MFHVIVLNTGDIISKVYCAILVEVDKYTEHNNQYISLNMHFTFILRDVKYLGQYFYTQVHISEYLSYMFNHFSSQLYMRPESA